MQPTGPKRPAADGQRRWSGMITRAEFERLRLRSFVADVVPLSDWEFMGRTWIGEADGFTEWLRPADSVDRLGSLSLALEDLPESVSRAVFERLEIALTPGMKLSEVEAALGPSVSTTRLCDDRLTHNFEVGTADRYSVSCTIKADGGLVYVVVMALSL